MLRIVFNYSSTSIKAWYKGNEDHHCWQLKGFLCNSCYSDNSPIIIPFKASRYVNSRTISEYYTKTQNKQTLWRKIWPQRPTDSRIWRFSTKNSLTFCITTVVYKKAFKWRWKNLFVNKLSWKSSCHKHNQNYQKTSVSV